MELASEDYQGLAVDDELDRSSPPLETGSALGGTGARRIGRVNGRMLRGRLLPGTGSVRREKADARGEKQRQTGCTKPVAHQRSSCD